MPDYDVAFMALIVADAFLLLFNFILLIVLPACAAGAFTVCALSWWHLIEFGVIFVAAVQITARMGRRKHEDSDGAGFPATLGAFVALGVFAVSITIAALRYSLVIPLTLAAWQYTAAWFVDVLFVFAGFAHAVIWLAILVNFGTAVRPSRGYSPLRD